MTTLQSTKEATISELSEGACPEIPPVQKAKILLKKLQTEFTVFRDTKALSIGIDKALREKMPEIERKVLRIALGLHTHSLRYLKVMENATERFDLEGNVADSVPEEHRAHAKIQIAERAKKVADRKEAEKQARILASKERKQEEAHQQKLSLLLDKFAK